MCKFRELPSAEIRIIQCRIELCICWVITVIKKINEYINVTPLAHSSDEIKWINIDFFLEISCSGSNVSLHWYHKGFIVYTALTADPALTPYYPTADRSHSGNIWLVLNAAKTVHETSSSPFAQFDLILGWTTWKWLWATWNYNEMLKQPICERIGHGWRFHALQKYTLIWKKKYRFFCQYVYHVFHISHFFLVWLS